jgi:hypothetical protein
VHDKAGDAAHTKVAVLLGSLAVTVMFEPWQTFGVVGTKFTAVGGRLVIVVVAVTLHVALPAVNV